MAVGAAGAFGVRVPDENPSGMSAFDLPLRLPRQYYDRETITHYDMMRDLRDLNAARRTSLRGGKQPERLVRARSGNS